MILKLYLKWWVVKTRQIANIVAKDLSQCCNLLTKKIEKGDSLRTFLRRMAASTYVQTNTRDE